MVVLQVVSAAGGNGVEVMAPSGPALARSDTGAMELIVGVVHLIDPEHDFRAVLVER